MGKELEAKPVHRPITPSQEPQLEGELESAKMRLSAPSREISHGLPATEPGEADRRGFITDLFGAIVLADPQDPEGQRVYFGLNSQGELVTTKNEDNIFFR